MVRRVREIARWEDARLVASTARHTGVFADESGAGARLDLQRVDRADVEAFGGRALETRLLMELAAVGICSLDQRVDLRLRVVEDADTRHVRQTVSLVLLRTDDLARETADAECWVGEDHALGELGRVRRRGARDGRAAERFQGHERDDRCRSAQEVATRNVRPLSLSVLLVGA